MADYCVDCAVDDMDALYGVHDLGNRRGWYLCEGCGYHIFDKGIRVCRRGSFTVDEAWQSKPCEDCAALMGTDEGV